MIRLGYCRHCSVEKEDERFLHFRESIVTCSHCGRRLYLVPESEGSPYYFFEEIKEEEE
jgi:DNA transposition AAA+ family ATPase